MKRVLLSLVVVVCTSTAAAQNRIELYGDDQMSTCSISEPASPPIVQVHVFLAGSVPSTGVRFKVPTPVCWVGAAWIGDAVHPSHAGTGTSQTEWSVAFSSCAPGPVYLGAIYYRISNQALPCCKVEPLPTGGQFMFLDCDFVAFDLAEGRPIIVNPDETCGCQGGIILKTESTTWGRVKSLYRD